MSSSSTRVEVPAVGSCPPAIHGRTLHPVGAGIDRFALRRTTGSKAPNALGVAVRNGLNLVRRERGAAVTFAETDAGETRPLAVRSHDHLVPVGEKAARLAVGQRQRVPAAIDVLHEAAPGARRLVRDRARTENVAGTQASETRVKSSVSLWLESRSAVGKWKSNAAGRRDESR